MNGRQAHEEMLTSPGTVGMEIRSTPTGMLAPKESENTKRRGGGRGCREHNVAGLPQNTARRRLKKRKLKPPHDPASLPYTPPEFQSGVSKKHLHRSQQPEDERTPVRCWTSRCTRSGGRTLGRKEILTRAKTQGGLEDAATRGKTVT